MMDERKNKMYDHILLIGFGGPEKIEDVRPFIEKVAMGRNIPDSRLKEVENHYRQIGGFSPYNGQIKVLAGDLEEKLKLEGENLPVFFGMRNWHPFLSETIETIRDAGLTQGLGIVVAPHRSHSSCGRYKEDVVSAKLVSKAHLVHYDYLDAYYDHEDFINMHADLLVNELGSHVSTKKTKLLFSAHSIPVKMKEMCSHCSYANEFETTAELVAKKTGISDYETVYQSRSGSPQDPWLEPDILDAVKKAGAEGYARIVVDPIGFIVENAEILFDLDIEVRELADQMNVEFLRIPTISSHSTYVSMLTKFISKKRIGGLISCIPE